MSELDYEFITAQRERVLARETDFSTYALPSVDSIERDEVYEYIVEAERCFAKGAHQGYDEGVAEYDDQIFTIYGLGSTLLTTEHATVHFRLPKSGGQQRRRIGPDLGTAGLGLVARRGSDASFVTLLGKQTGDANHDVSHVFKDAMNPIVAAPHTAAHLSIHGMNFGRVASLEDERAFNVLIGIGDNPTEETKDFVDKALAVAAKYNLRADVNRPVIQFEPGSHIPRRQEDGLLHRITLAAKGAGTTRTYSAKTAELLQKPFIAAQLELSSSLRLLPEDLSTYPGIHQQKIGVHLGYLFVRECVELVDASKITR